jgi:hypothetical protein
MMRKRLLVLALGALFALSATSTTQASIRLNFAANPASVIEFTGTGSGASFALLPGLDGNDFTITSVNNGAGTSIGLQGNLAGSFAYTSASITTGAGGQQDAPLTGTVTLTILDGATPFTASMSGIEITTTGTGGVVNVGGAVNLSGLSYAGSNADLVALFNQASANGGISTLSFQFIPALSLTDLAKAGVQSTSYAGSLTAAPEPATIAMAFTALPILGLFLARRRG